MLRKSYSLTTSIKFFFADVFYFSSFVSALTYFCIIETHTGTKLFNWGNIHSMSSSVKQVWLVMLINFCLLHLRCLGSLGWLRAIVSSERATSSLSGAGGNLLHTSNWTKCLSNSQPSYTDHIIIQSRCQQRVVFFQLPLPSSTHSLTKIPPLEVETSGGSIQLFHVW